MSERIGTWKSNGYGAWGSIEGDWRSAVVLNDDELVLSIAHKSTGLGGAIPVAVVLRLIPDDVLWTELARRTELKTQETGT